MIQSDFDEDRDISIVRVCVCVCVRAPVRPRGYTLHSCDIELAQPGEQVCCIYKRNEAFYAQT